jgi:hypothetical protein
MTYTPYLIANYSTGLDKQLQPWLSPDDSQQELLDGYVYRGTMSKREGYNYFATGERGGAPYRESRIVHSLVDVPMVGAIDGTNRVFTLAGTAQIARGSITVTGSNPTQVLVDNGLGTFTGDGVGTVNYITGSISVTLTVAPIVASTVTITYSFMPDLPVMMSASYINNINIRELIVCDTAYVNRYNSTLNILQDITTTPYTGNKFNFFTWVNYADGEGTPRLLFSNNKDNIQQYDGSVVSDYTYMMESSFPVPNPVTALTCASMVEMKDRLILLRTTETSSDGTIIYGKRIRISGTGVNSDDFRTSATGAGFIDIPDATWINGAAFNRDDLIIFTEQSTWVLKYTGNDTVPFVLLKIDESRGCDATFAVITYLNKTSAVSKRGLIITDGYVVERQDQKIPDFTFNEINNGADSNQSYFSLCFAGSVDADRDHYLIYPPQGEVESKRILVTNYDEENYSNYRLPLSCMGTFQTSFNVTWDDLLSFPTWDAMAAAYGSWYSFSYTDGVPFSIGGGHHGEIWRLGVTEAEDNIVRIYNITVIDDQTIEVTTDWNNYIDGGTSNTDPTLGADYIFITGVVGMIEINDQQFPVTTIISNNVFQLDVSTAVTPYIPATEFGAYVSGGRAQRVIPFYSLFKQFNPFIMMDKKVRCGWIYMYVDASSSSLLRKIAISGITKSSPCVVTTLVPHGFANLEQVSFSGIVGMTELNNTQAFITLLSPTTFSLNGVDSTGFTTYVSGGYAGVKEKSKILIDVLTNDRNPDDFTQLVNLSQNPYQGNCSNLAFEDGAKKWYKVYINQVGKFIQFLFRNAQAGAKINIQATMPGFQPVGRII